MKEFLFMPTIDNIVLFKAAINLKDSFSLEQFIS